MDRLSVWQRHDPEMPSQVVDPDPVPNTSVRLRFAANRVAKRCLTPFQTDIGTFGKDVFLEVPGGW